MKAKLFLQTIVLGMAVGSMPAIGQDTMFISLGNDLLHTAITSPDVLNTPGQVDGGLTGATWNLVTDANEAPVLNWSDGTSSTAFVTTGRGSGSGTEGFADFEAGQVHWWGTLGSNGTYAVNPDVDPLNGAVVSLTGILTGPAVSQGMSWQKSAGIRIRDLPHGTYEVYATGVPYSRNLNTGGALEGQDVDMYIGTTIDALGGAQQVLEDDLLAGTLTKTTLPHTNYATWQEGDNYAKTIVTIGTDIDGATDSLVVAVDLSMQGAQIFASLGTIEIRQISAALAGDFDSDGDVDGADFLEWQRNPAVGSLSDWEGSYGTPPALGASFATVPEPTSLLLTCIGLLAAGLTTRSRQPLT